MNEQFYTYCQGLSPGEMQLDIASAPSSDSSPSSSSVNIESSSISASSVELGQKEPSMKDSTEAADKVRVLKESG